MIHDTFVALAMFVSAGNAPSATRAPDPMVRTAEKKPDRATFGLVIAIDMEARNAEMGPFRGQPVYCSEGNINCVSTVFGRFAGPRICGQYRPTGSSVQLRRLGKVRWRAGRERRRADVLYIEGQGHAVWLFDDKHGLVGITISGDLTSIIEPFKEAADRNKLQQAVDARHFNFKPFAKSFLPCIKTSTSAG